MNDKIPAFLIDTTKNLVYAAVCAALAIGILALFGRHIGWWHAYTVSLTVVYLRVLIFDADWIR